MSGGRPSSYKPEMCEQVVELMAQGDSQIMICAKFGISRMTFRNWCSKDSDFYKPDFAEAVERGLELAQAFWETELRKATLGINQDANSTLMIFTLKNRFREDWRESQNIQHSISRNAEELTDDELAAIASGSGTTEETEGKE